MSKSLKSNKQFQENPVLASIRKGFKVFKPAGASRIVVIPPIQLRGLQSHSILDFWRSKDAIIQQRS